MVKNNSEFTGAQVSRDLTRLFSGEMTEQDASKISGHMAESEEYQSEFLKLSSILSNPDGLGSMPGIRTVMDESIGSDRKGWISSHRLGMTAAAILLIAIFVVSFLFVPREESVGTDNLARYITRVGEQKTISLTDGSSLVLNTGTQVYVDITDSYRRIILERGEIFVDVVPDQDRPFSVDLDTRSITVLGTSFNIYKKPDSFSVSVVSGLVAIHKKGDPVSGTSPLINSDNDEKVRLTSPDQNRLQAGWRADFDENDGSIMAYRSPNMSRLFSWRTGVIRFEEAPLYEVVQELNRYSGKKILIEDKSIMDLEFYGSIRVDQLHTAVKGFEEILPVKVMHHFDRVVIVGKY